MEWFYLALLNPAIFALINILDDNMLKGIYKTPYFGTIVTGLFALLPLLGLFFFKIAFPPINIILVALTAGFILIITYFFYFKALEVETPSIIVSLWLSSVAIVPFLAYIFLNEVFNFNQYIGIILILISSFILSVNFKELKFSKAAIFMIIASILSAFMVILEKYVYSFIDFYSGFVFISFGIGIGALFFMVFFKEGRKFPKQFFHSRKWLWLFILTELINIFGVFLVNYTISKGPVSLIEAIAGIQPLYVLIFSILLYPFFPKYFRDAVHGNNMKKFVCMLVIVIGLYLINS